MWMLIVLPIYNSDFQLIMNYVLFYMVAFIINVKFCVDCRDSVIIVPMLKSKFHFVHWYQIARIFILRENGT